VHTVTKVLVVFAAVLCILLAALTMAYSVNSERITGDYRAEVDRRLQADSTVQTRVAQAQEEQGRLREANQALSSRLLAQETKIRDLEGERTQLIADVQAARTSRDAIQNQTEMVMASNNTLTQINKSYAEEVGRLRDSELQRSRREIELVDRINDLESQREVLDSSVRALKEQLAEAQRTIQQGGTGRGIADAPFKPNFPIQGRVVATGKDPATGRPMATINVGANDQVRENMELVISRNGKFLANFVVTRTDLQWSMGRIDMLNQNVQIQEGDIVSTLAAR
jgi:hypothetical protein